MSSAPIVYYFVPYRLNFPISTRVYSAAQSGSVDPSATITAKVQSRKRVVE
jgi:hypothetical protein